MKANAHLSDEKWAEHIDSTLTVAQWTDPAPGVELSERQLLHNTVISQKAWLDQRLDIMLSLKKRVHKLEALVLSLTEKMDNT